MFNFPTFWTAEFLLQITARPILGGEAGTLPLINTVSRNVANERVYPNICEQATS